MMPPSQNNLILDCNILLKLCVFVDTEGGVLHLVSKELLSRPSVAAASTYQPLHGLCVELDGAISTHPYGLPAFLFHKVFHVAVVTKPSQVISNQMLHLTVWARDNDQSVLVGLSCEALHSPRVAFPTCESHIQVLRCRCDWFLGRPK